MLTFRGLIYSVLNKLNINGTSDFQKTNMQMKKNVKVEVRINVLIYK